LGAQVSTRSASSSSASVVELQPRPTAPKLLLSSSEKSGWFFLAVTFQKDDISMHVDNSDYTFLQTNWSCLNLANSASATLESVPRAVIVNVTGSLFFSQFRIFNTSFDPVFRGFASQITEASINFRPTSAADLASKNVLSWNLNLCDCALLKNFSSNTNQKAILMSTGAVSVVFRSVPWLLPQIDSFSPSLGYQHFAL
jgi:hypothetical protein